MFRILSGLALSPSERRWFRFSPIFFFSFSRRSSHGIQEDPPISIRISREQISQDPYCFSKSVLIRGRWIREAGRILRPWYWFDGKLVRRSRFRRCKFRARISRFSSLSFKTFLYSHFIESPVKGRFFVRNSDFRKNRATPLTLRLKCAILFYFDYFELSRDKHMKSHCSFMILSCYNCVSYCELYVVWLVSKFDFTSLRRRIKESSCMHHKKRIKQKSYTYKPSEVCDFSQFSFEILCSLTCRSPNLRLRRDILYDNSSSHQFYGLRDESARFFLGHLVVDRQRGVT